MNTFRQLIRPAVAAALLIFTLSGYALAQKKPVPAKEGFWVVETNRQPARQTIVRFYDRHNTLIYQEELPKKRLNIHRAGTVKRLNEALDQVMTQWALGKQRLPEKNLVAAQFRK